MSRREDILFLLGLWIIGMGATLGAVVIVLALGVDERGAGAAAYTVAAWVCVMCGVGVAIVGGNLTLSAPGCR